MTIRQRFTLEAIEPILDAAGFRVRDMGLLAAALDRPWVTFEGKELYPNPWLKAGALIHSIESSHPLVDGNKRLGVLLGSIVLRTHGIDDMRISDDQWFEVVIRTAAVDSIPEGIGHQLYVAWLESRP
ncbi:Fic family protein [Corynebacterium sp. CCUG 70398]|uniref:type II toxin-antitoxin system death-on-curing family toxin n=1 Tax=Corynebacterium sp. CCUG 70398 TaxID=2823891 RepID=UPI00210CAE77|nr:Fic family protein [Corynebacterium sp. CCUG 70398]